jgi:signal transduction histidine kinase
VRELLRSIWDEPRAPGAPARVWRDWVLVAVLIPTALIEGVMRQDIPARTFTVAVAVALVPTLLWRRTHPLRMVAITFGVCGLASVVTGADLGLNTLVFVLLFPYALYRWGSGRDIVLGSAIVLVKLGSSTALGYLSLGESLGGLALLFAISALGVALRFRAGARVRQLEGVRLRERERLARDLHDTVAHHVSAMAIRAQAGLATAASRPDAATDALRVIEAEASRALTEMRTMVRGLRRDQPVDTAPSPKVADLERLTTRSGDGPAVTVLLTGDVNDLPEQIAAAIYRLAQESVTNARRHARHATAIEVHVAVDATSVRLRVSDDGDLGLLRSGALPGFGLIGMRERADLLGGVCEAGPNPGRGWTVTAVLPRAGASA